MSTLEPPTTERRHLKHIGLPAGSGSAGRDIAWQRLRSTLFVLAAIYIVSLAAYAALARQFATGPTTPIVAALMLIAIFGIVVRALDGHEHPRFGSANAITAVRAAMVSFFAGAVLLAELEGANGSLLPVLIILVVIALVLDGVDGHLARRTGLQSPLGTRFDMEVDALLILMLSLAAFLFGKAGGWVLAIGLMRYGFVLAQIVLPFLNAPLPPSFRRKLICVVQVGALCLILAPMIAPPVSTTIAASALLLITYSFGVDVIYLFRERHRSA